MHAFLMKLMVYFISYSGGCYQVDDSGAKVSFFMHEWIQIVMFQEQKWQLSHTLKESRLSDMHFIVICFEIQCKGGPSG